MLPLASKPIARQVTGVPSGTAAPLTSVTNACAVKRLAVRRCSRGATSQIWPGSGGVLEAVWPVVTAMLSLAGARDPATAVAVIVMLPSESARKTPQARPLLSVRVVWKSPLASTMQGWTGHVMTSPDSPVAATCQVTVALSA